MNFCFSKNIPKRLLIFGCGYKSFESKKQLGSNPQNKKKKVSTFFAEIFWATPKKGLKFSKKSSNMTVLPLTTKKIPQNDCFVRTRQKITPK
jgi:hypothetical protein